MAVPIVAEMAARAAATSGGGSLRQSVTGGSNSRQSVTGGVVTAAGGGFGEQLLEGSQVKGGEGGAEGKYFAIGWRVCCRQRGPLVAGIPVTAAHLIPTLSPKSPPSSCRV